MRNRFIDLIHEEMASNEDVVFLTADMGINLVEKIQKDYPDRFLNVGIAEQNLIGIAAGLAESGLRPFAYTISNFITIRALEQIRNDLVLHKLPVTLVGTSTGFDNGPLGPTHHMLDDWGVLSGMPGLNIYCPSAESSVDSTFLECLALVQPCYVRIPKGSGVKTNLNSLKNQETLVLTYGSAASYAIHFALANAMDYQIIERLHPLNIDLEQLKAHKTIIVIEDHFSSIGLYSKICQVLNEIRAKAYVKSISPVDYSLTVGKDLQDFL